MGNVGHGCGLLHRAGLLKGSSTVINTKKAGFYDHILISHSIDVNFTAITAHKGLQCIVIDTFYIKGQTVCWDTEALTTYDLGASFNLAGYNITPWLRQFKEPTKMSRRSWNSESYAVCYGVWCTFFLPLLQCFLGKSVISTGHCTSSWFWHCAVWVTANHAEALILWSLLQGWVVMLFSLPCDSDQWWYLDLGGVRENRAWGWGMQMEGHWRPRLGGKFYATWMFLSIQEELPVSFRPLLN